MAAGGRARVAVRAGLALLVAIVLVAGLRPGAADAQVVPRPRYEIELRLDLAAARGDVRQVVTYPNQTGQSLSSLVFHITAAHYNAFALRTVRVGEEPVSPTLDGIVLEVPLPRPLAAGQTITVTFEYGLTLPNPGNLRFGSSQGIYALGNWYPVLAVYRRGPFAYDGRLPEGWDRHQQGTPSQLASGLEPGDAFFTDVADYAVNLTLDSPARVAHTGTQLAAEGSRSFRLQALGVRDFALAISERYEVASATVGGTTVSAFYLPEHRAGGQQYLQSAMQALAWFNQTLGAYPYASFQVAETASYDPAWVGQEYPQLIFISSQSTAGQVGMGSYLSYLVAHETLHQWFYGLVGNDQLYEPWVDEALATQMSYRFLEAMDLAIGQAYWHSLAERRQQDAATWPDRPVNTAIYDYADEGHYFAIVYRKGAAFLEEVRHQMGDAAYLAALRVYVDRFRGSLASGRDLLATLEGAAGPAIRPLVARYFSYPEFAATATATAAAGEPTALPSATPLPTATAGTPTPSPTPGPEPATTPTETPTPTATPTPLATATGTPPPAATATATATVSPTPLATATPEPTATPPPTPTSLTRLLARGEVALAAAGALVFALLGLAVLGRRRT